MERGTRRLLHDLDAFGRLTLDRPSAWERLELEVGPMLAKQLVPVEGAKPSTRSGGRRRRVA